MDAPNDDDDAPESSTEALYARLGEWDDATRDALWHRWLWGTDCTARPTERCYDMNEMHVLGILCCLGESVRAQAELPCCERLVLVPGKPAATLTLRETLDQLESYQLSWGPALDALGHLGALAVLRALMARLGELMHHAYPMAEPDPLDDPQHVTPLPGDEGLGVVARKSMRQAVCVLFALLRVQWIAAHALPVVMNAAEVRAVVDALHVHHIEASLDSFNDLQQMMHLAPGMRLVYRTNFAGMYNHVSQVVFFHYPRFCRQPQLDIARIPESPMHMLPLVQQLLPDVPIAFDDDGVIPGLTAAAPPRFTWLVCCGAIFLLDECGDVRSGTLAALVAHLLRASGRSIAANETDRIARVVETIAHAPHAHVRLL